MSGKGRARHYPFPLPDWPVWMVKTLPGGLVDEIAAVFPRRGLPKLTERDLLRLEVCIQRFVYSQDWP